MNGKTKRWTKNLFTGLLSGLLPKKQCLVPGLASSAQSKTTSTLLNVVSDSATRLIESVETILFWAGIEEKNWQRFQKPGNFFAFINSAADARTGRRRLKQWAASQPPILLLPLLLQLLLLPLLPLMLWIERQREMLRLQMFLLSRIRKGVF